MSGGQGRLKPSPGNFFVASKPSLLPLAISLLAWSSTSDGPLVKMLSRCGSVLAQRGAHAPRVHRSAPSLTESGVGSEELRVGRGSRHGWSRVLSISFGE